MRIGSAEEGVRSATGLATEAWCGLSAGARLVLGRGRARATGAVPARVVRRGTLARPPVMLVHGLGADKSCFSTMEERLHAAGHTVYSVSYSCVGTDVEACGRVLEGEAAWLLAETGSEVLHVVAHSLGGVVLRWAAAHTGLVDWLTLGITLGSPHRGTPTARLAPQGLPGFGTIINQLRPGCPTLAQAGLGAPGFARWVAVAAQNDWLVPPRYAALPPVGNVRNAVVPWTGHMGLTRHPHSVSLVLEELAAVGATTLLRTRGRDVSRAVSPSSLCA